MVMEMEMTMQMLMEMLMELETEMGKRPLALCSLGGSVLSKSKSKSKDGSAGLPDCRIVGLGLGLGWDGMK